MCFNVADVHICFCCPGKSVLRGSKNGNATEVCRNRPWERSLFFDVECFDIAGADPACHNAGSTFQVASSVRIIVRHSSSTDLHRYYSTRTVVEGEREVREKGIRSHEDGGHKGDMDSHQTKTTAGKVRG